MAGKWTYDPTKFNDTSAGAYTNSTIGARNQIRFLVRDTNVAKKLFYDEEIDWTYTVEANVFCAAAALCESLAVASGNIGKKKVGELSIEYSPKMYRDLAGQLRARGAGHQVPYAGGISISDKEARQANTDWVPAAIPRGLDNNPAAPQPATPSTNPLTTI